MKTALKIFLLVSLFSIVNSAYAGNWKIGAFLGQSSFDELNDVCTEAEMAANSLIGPDFSFLININCSADDSDSAIGFNIGYQFNNYLGIETGYVDLGEYGLEMSASSNDPRVTIFSPSSQLNISASALYIAGVATWPFSDKLSLSGRMGAVEISADVSATGGIFSDVESDPELMYGASLDYQISDSISLGLRSDVFDGTFATYGIGLNYHF